MTTDELQARLAHLARLDPPTRLTVRIEHSLATGVALPALAEAAASHSSRGGRRMVIAAGIAAAVAAILWPRGGSRLPIDEDSSWLVPRSALAQTNSRDFPPLSALLPGRIRAGTWTYRSTTRGPGGYLEDRGETVLTVAAAGHGPDSAWVLTRRGRQPIGTGGVSVDSVVVRRGTLAPVARTRVPWGGTMLFRGDSMLVELPRLGLRRGWPLPSIEREPYLVELATLLPAIPFAPGFRAGIPILAIFGMDQPTLPLGMEVEGQDLVSVPAGTFRCYRVRLGSWRDGDVWWVDSESGRLVKTARHWSGDMEDETVLTAVR